MISIYFISIPPYGFSVSMNLLSYAMPEKLAEMWTIGAVHAWYAGDLRSSPIIEPHVQHPYTRVRC